MLRILVNSRPAPFMFLIFALFFHLGKSASAKPHCKLYQAGGTLWVLGVKEITAVHPKTGKWLGAYRLSSAQKSCPKVLQKDNMLFVLLKNQWVLLSRKGEVLDEGKWEGEATVFSSGNRIWVLGENQDALIDLDQDKNGKPLRRLPISGPGKTGTPLNDRILLSSKKERPPNPGDLVIVGRVPSPYTETVGSILLSNREFNKTTLMLELNGTQLFGAKNWQLDLDGTANWLGIYDGYLLVQKDQSQIGAWKLTTGFQEQWFSPFDFRLGKVRVKTSGRQPYLEEEDSGIPLNFDVSVDMPLGSVGNLYLLRANDFVSSVEWTRENSLMVQLDSRRGQTNLVLSDRFVAKAKDVGIFVRPERSKRIGLPLAATRLAITGDGGVFGFSEGQAVWLPSNDAKPQMLVEETLKKAPTVSESGKGKLPPSLKDDLFP